MLEAGRFEELLAKGSRLDAQALRSVLPLMKDVFADQPKLATMLAKLVTGDWIEEPSAKLLKGSTREQRDRLSTYIHGREWLKMAPPHLVQAVESVNAATRQFPDYERLLRRA